MNHLTEGGRCKPVFETLEPRFLLAADFAITGLTLAGGAANPFDVIDIGFSHEVDETSFTLDDVLLESGGAPLAPAGDPVRLDATHYRLDFTGLTGLGVYRLEIGPDVLDADGDKLDQDGDGTGGEVDEDVYRLTFASMDLTIADGDAQYDGADLIVHDSTVTIDGAHAFTALRVESGGMVTHSPATGTETYGLSLAISGALEIDATSSIDVSGRGYTDNHTTGNADLGIDGKAGGSYGGLGYHYWAWPTNDVYGDFRNPDEPGSGGRGADDSAGHGGGLVRISSGSARIDGAIRADGASGRYFSYTYGGGGSGGGVYLDVGLLSGVGVVSADGGIGYTTASGAGGGGRVAVYCDVLDGFDLGGVTSSGGATGSDGQAAAGTVYVETDGVGELRIAGGGNVVFTPIGIASDAEVNVDRLVVSGAYAVPHHNMPINTGDVEIIDGALLSHRYTTTNNEYRLDLAVTGTLLIDSTSSIDVTARGYTDNHTAGNADMGVEGRAGGSYGGLGYHYWAWPTNDVYGDFMNPDEPGSGGRGADDSAGHGGGLVRISSGAARIDGAIRADGASGRYFSHTYGGAGSGGGVCLDVGALSGVGVISADGGIGYTTFTGAGGGGRVAVYFDVLDGFDLGGVTSSGGATGKDGQAAAGTVYVETDGVGELRIAGGGDVVFTPIGIAGDSGVEVDRLVVSGAYAVPHHNMPINTGDVEIIDGALLSHRYTTTGNDYRLDLAVTGALLIDATSSIDVSGRGYTGNYTLGNTTIGAATGESGGSYGGLGADDAGQANAIYGDATFPDEPGSGGSGARDSGGSGGGIVHISSGAVAVDGVIRADGAPGTYTNYRRGGGGSGGAAYLDVGVLSGSGAISADGGVGNGTLTGAGGGGRVAVYYSNTMTLDPGSVTAVGGATGSSPGQAGTVHIEQVPENSRPPIVLSAGPEGRFNTDVEILTVQFSEAIDESTFSGDDVTVILPGGGQIPPGEISVAPAGMWRYEIHLPVLSTDGTYQAIVGTGITDLHGNALANAHQFEFTIDRTPPQIVSVAPSGETLPPFSKLVVTFNEDITEGSFTVEDVTFEDPSGQAVAISQVVRLSGDTCELRFAEQTVSGDYSLAIGPAIEDVVGNAMAQEYSTTITLSIPDLALSDAACSSQAYAGDEILATWVVANQGDAPAGGAWTDNLYLEGTGGEVHVASINYSGTLAPGESISRAEHIVIPEHLMGVYRLIVRSNINQAVYECGRIANNTVAAAGTIDVQEYPCPNLQVSDVQAPAEVFSGVETSISWTVLNSGSGATTATMWTDEIWLCTDPQLDKDVDLRLGCVGNPYPLGAGQSYTGNLTATIPDGIEGDRYIVVITDYRFAVREDSNRDDNVSPGEQFSVVLSPWADLQVPQVIAPVQGFSDNALDLTWRVRNCGQGATRQDAWSDRIYLSVDETLSGDDAYLGYTSHSGALAAGSEYEASTSVYLPTGVSGPYYLLVLTDAREQVFEHSAEGNNTGSTALQMHLTPPPELSVTDVQFSAGARAGLPLDITYVLANDGSLHSSSSYRFDALYLSADDQFDPGNDILLGMELRMGLWRDGGAETFDAAVTLPVDVEGDYYVFVVADANDNIFELNNDDNVGRSAGAMTVASLLPDLVVTGVTTSVGAGCEAGDTLAIGWTVQNQGTGVTPTAAWTDAVYLSLTSDLSPDIPLRTFHHGGALDPQQSYEMWETVTLPQDAVGQYWLYVETDYQNYVYEGPADAGNLSGGIGIQVNRSPADLEAGGLQTPATAVSGQTLAVQYHVENVGQGITSDRVWSDAVFLSTGGQIDAESILLTNICHYGRLGFGDSYDVSIDCNLPIDLDGDYHVIVVVDYSGNVEENLQTLNNTVASAAAVSISLGDVPDLAVRDVTAPTSAIGGHEINVQWRVVNNGADTGSGSWYDAVYLSRDQFFDKDQDVLLVSTLHVGGLAGGGDYAGDVTTTVPADLAGPFYVFAATDVTERLYERGDLFNNAAFAPQPLTVSLGDPIDLVAGQVAIPASARSGQRVTIDYTVRNEGSFAAQGDWYDAVYLSGDTAWSSDDLFVGHYHAQGPLPDGEEYSGQVASVLPGALAGDYHVIVRSDVYARLAEENRANNISASVTAMTVEAPYLGDQSVTETISTGESHYWRLQGEGGKVYRLTLDGGDEGAFHELYARYGQPPTQSEFDATYSTPFWHDQEILLEANYSGDYYILARCVSDGGEETSYTLQADELAMEITHVGVTSGSNRGRVTVSLQGALLEGMDQVSLVGQQTTRHAAELHAVSDGELWATFDLTGMTAGVYDILADGEHGQTTRTQVFTVTDGAVGRLEATLDQPSVIRADQGMMVHVRYRNAGQTDLSAPMFMLAIDNGEFRMPDGQRLTSLSVMGVSAAGPGGVLAPGSGSVISIPVLPTVGSGGEITVSLSPFDAGTAVDWAAMEQDLRDESMPDEAWDLIFANFRGQVGETMGQYAEVLAENATRLSLMGRRTGSVNDLLQFELLQAGQFGQIAQRFYTSTFGYGQSDVFGMTAWCDDAQAVVKVGQSERVYYRRQGSSASEVYYDAGAGQSDEVACIDGVLQLRDPDGTITVFRPDGRVDRVVNPGGDTTQWHWDDGLLLGFTDPLGRRTEFVYDADGLVSQIIDPDGRTASMTYDNNHHLIQRQTPDGLSESWTYFDGPEPYLKHAVESHTAKDGVTMFNEYDTCGRIVRTRYSDGATAKTYSYDSAGGVTTTFADGSSTVEWYNDSGFMGKLIDSAGESLDLRYNAHGGLTELLGPLGSAGKLQYDRTGRLVGSVDPSGASTGNPLNADNTPESYIDEAGNVVEFTYDAEGRPAEIIWANGATRHKHYDDLGRLAGWTNRRGQSAQLILDSITSRILNRITPEGQTDYTYDAAGNLLTVTDAAGTVDHTYNADNRITSVTDANGRTIDYTYDANGRRTRMTADGGFVVNYEYNARGLLSALRDNQGDLIVSYAYDDANRIHRQDRANGSYSIWEYDDTGQVGILTHYDAAGATLSRYEHQRDELGRRIGMTTLQGQWTYDYDASGRLESAEFDSTEPGISDVHQTYAYDADGNRRLIVNDGLETPYHVNEFEQVLSAGDVTYNYDADGNLIARSGGETWTLTFDSFNHLTSFTGPGGTWSYEYDAFGNRTAVNSPQGRTEYLLDPLGTGSVIGEYDGQGALVANYVHGLALESAVLPGGQANFHHHDAQGNTAIVTDAFAAVVNEYAYAPFGESIVAIETVDNDFEYSGAWGVMHDDTGLMYMRNRYYLAEEGRFITVDPINDVDGMYAYCKNDPVGAIDPDGMKGSPTSWGAAMGYNPNSSSQNSSLPNAHGWGVAMGHRPQVRPLSGSDVNSALQFLTNMDDPVAWIEIGISTSGAEVFGEDAMPSINFWCGNMSLGYSLFNTSALVTAGTIAPGAWAGLATVPGALGVIGAAFTGVQIGTAFVQLPPWAQWSTCPLLAAVNFGSQYVFTTYFNWRYRPQDILNVGRTDVIRSRDPNDILGPEGHGDENWTGACEPLGYTIRFENAPDATAPAQTIVIEQQLDDDLDWRTFRVGEFGWSGMVFEGPADSPILQQRLDLLDSHGFYVDVFAGVDVLSGKAFWSLATIDPETGAAPADPTVGLLPPEIDGLGQGFVHYTVSPYDDVVTATVIDAEATIVFDSNLPIDTPPIFNTIDADAPAAQIDALSPHSEPDFLLSWSAQDAPGGSGLAGVSIYVSADGEPYELYLADTESTEVAFHGQIGHTYAFQACAGDLAGNFQPLADVSQAVTTIASPTVAGRHVFYNNSAWDGEDPAAGPEDDAAIADDKSVLLPGGVVTPANYSAYNRGINGIMVDINDLAATPAAGDFDIRVNETGGVDAWSQGPAPSVSVRPGQGVGGSDRVTLVWTDGAIANKWIEVTVSAGGNVGLEADDVFYFGNVVGEADGDRAVGQGDYEMLTEQFGMRGEGLAADFNGDAVVDLEDLSILQAYEGNTLALPPVLPGDADGSGVVDGGDCEILTARFGQRGRGLTGDFDGDGRIGLADFAILRSNFGNALPATAPVTAMAAAPAEPTGVSVVPVVNPLLDNNEDVDDDSIATAASAPAVDLLAELPSPGEYLSPAAAISSGAPMTTPYRRATGQYDLRPTSDDPGGDAAGDGLLADILTEAALAIDI